MIDGFIDLYESRGFSLVPLRSGSKVPAAVSWAPEPGKLSAAERKIAGNLGLKTGTPSGVWVVDIDDPEAITDRRLEPILDFPATQSPNGFHFYGRLPAGFEDRNAKLFLDGRNIGDLKGTGGYVVVPPSVVDGKPYLWIKELDGSVPEFPSELLRLLVGSNGQGREIHLDLAPRGLDGVSEGERNNAAFRIALYLMEHLYSEQAVWNLLNGWNRLNRPPLDEDELRTVFRNAMKYVHTPEKMIEGQMKLNEILATTTPPPARLGDITYAGCISLLFGYASSGKSIFGIREGLRVGRFWPVYYVDLECPLITVHRVRTMVAEDGLEPDGIDFTLLTGFPDWDRVLETDGLFIIDTIRASGTMNLNHSEEAQVYLNRWRTWLSRNPDSRSVLLIGHSNKLVFSPLYTNASGLTFLEGSSYWTGGSDVVAHYYNDGTTRTVRVLKNRVDGVMRTIRVRNYESLGQKEEEWDGSLELL